MAWFHAKTRKPLVQNRGAIDEAQGVEFQFLVACQRHHILPRVSAALKFPGSLDWTRFRQAAIYHGVTPTTFLSLSTSGLLSHLSPDEAARLQEDYRLISAFNLAQAVELIEIVTKLKAAGLTPLPFKGPVLAQQLHDDLTARESYDLDLILRRGEVFLALDLLLAAGCRWAGFGPRPSRDTNLAAHHAYTVQSSDGRFLIDLHWEFGEDVTRHLAPDVEQLFANQETVDVLGRPLPAIRREDLLPLLSFHATRHRWYLLKWVVDIAALCSPPDFNWDHALRGGAAGSDQVAAVSRLGLGLADRLFDLDLPPEVRRSIERNAGVMSLIPGLIDDLEACRKPDKPAQHPLLLRLLPGAWARARYVAMLLRGSVFRPNDSDFRAFSLPRFLFPLYYVLRPLRLLVGYRHRVRQIFHALISGKLRPRPPAAERHTR